MTTAPIPVEPYVGSDAVATWLQLPPDTINEDAAEMCIAAAMLACRSVVSPIPALAGPIVVAVAARAYDNPTGASMTTEGAGPFTQGRTFKNAGVYLTDSERESLLAASGSQSGTQSGGAFTIDPTPATAAVPSYPWFGTAW